VRGGYCKFREAERRFQEREGQRVAYKCKERAICVSINVFSLGGTCLIAQRDLAA